MSDKEWLHYDIYERVLRYHLNMKSALGAMRLEDFDILNNGVSSHLCEVCAFLEMLYNFNDAWEEAVKIEEFPALVVNFGKLNREYTAKYNTDVDPIFHNPIYEDCRGIYERAWTRLYNSYKRA